MLNLAVPPVGMIEEIYKLGTEMSCDVIGYQMNRISSLKVKVSKKVL